MKLSYKLISSIIMFVIPLLLTTSCNKSTVDAIPHTDLEEALKQSSSYYEFRVELARYTDKTAQSLSQLSQDERNDYQSIATIISESGIDKLTSIQKDKLAKLSGFDNFSKFEDMTKLIQVRYNKFKNEEPTLAKLPIDLHLGLSSYFATKMEANNIHLKTNSIIIKNRGNSVDDKLTPNRLDDYDLCLALAIITYEVNITRCIILGFYTGGGFYMECAAGVGAGFNYSANKCHTEYLAS